MSAVTASAPGKLVLAGDYAVLDGAPALVMAVDRRAVARVERHSETGFLVDAPDLDIHAARACWQGGTLVWQDLDTATCRQLCLVQVVLEGLHALGVTVPACSMELDTSAFFGLHGQGKLGLGSSAALTVALSGALCALAEVALPSLDALIEVHRAMQGGRGSGLDIATSLLGGLVTYRLQGGRAEAARLDWPPGLRGCCVWSGRSASTGSALRHLEQWRARYAGAYAERMGELAEIAKCIEQACRMRDTPLMVDNTAAYAASLDRLGTACGLDIVCVEHRVLMQLAAECGVAYKSCGAGGGDVGMALAIDPDRLERFSLRVAAAGFAVLDLQMDEHGLRLERN